MMERRPIGTHTNRGPEGHDKVTRRDFLKSTALLASAMLLGIGETTFALPTRRLSLASGPMGSLYFAIGGGIAATLTRYCGMEAALEVTTGSVDNCKAIASKRSDLGLVLGDAAYDAFKGRGAFKERALPITVLTALYPNLTHVVTLGKNRIASVSDLKGKIVATGIPGSGTEVIALRLLEAAGLDPREDIKKVTLGPSRCARELKDGKIDAYIWSGGVPTSSILDLASSAGVTMALLGHDDLIPGMEAKYGPVYYRSIIPGKVYQGVNRDTPVSTVPNLLVCHRDMNPELAYDIVKCIFDHLKELSATHREALNINMVNGASLRSMPYHPGAWRFFEEKGFKLAPA